MHDMMRLLSDPIFLLFALVFFSILMGTLVKIFNGGGEDEQDGPFRRKVKARHGKLSADEAREMQELHKGFEDLARRIEALETILLDPARKR